MNIYSTYCDALPRRCAALRWRRLGGALTEDALVVDVLDAEPEARREGADQDVQVEEEGHPGGGLVLGHRRDDGDVDLGVAVGRKTRKTPD